MDNINHSCNKLISTNNSSWDSQNIISMEQQHNHIHNFHDHQYQNPPLVPIMNHPLLHHLQAEGEEAAEEEEEEEEELGAMKEMMYKMAAMQPVEIDPATIRKPKRRNVRISDDPQSVAARRRRERISERIRILQRLVPGGTKMDTASMLDEAIRYVKFLKRQIRLLNKPSPNNNNNNSSLLLASNSSSLDHNNWGSLENNYYKLLLSDQFNAHSDGKISGTTAAAGGFFAAGRGGRY